MHCTASASYGLDWVDCKFQLYINRATDWCYTYIACNSCQRILKNSICLLHHKFAIGNHHERKPTRSHQVTASNLLWIWIKAFVIRLWHDLFTSNAVLAHFSQPICLQLHISRLTSHSKFGTCPDSSLQLRHQHVTAILVLLTITPPDYSLLYTVQVGVVFGSFWQHCGLCTSLCLTHQN